MPLCKELKQIKRDIENNKEKIPFKLSLQSFKKINIKIDYCIRYIQINFEYIYRRINPKLKSFWHQYESAGIFDGNVYEFFGCSINIEVAKSGNSDDIEMETIASVYVTTDKNNRPLIFIYNDKKIIGDNRYKICTNMIILRKDLANIIKNYVIEKKKI